MKDKLRNLYLKIRSKIYHFVYDVFGYTEYKKFVIISDSRTGSTLVNNTLNFHPNIKAEGEVFKVLNSETSRQIWNKLFRKYPKKIKYVGFKLFYHHPLQGDKEVWDLVERDKSIIVLHLTRKNILRSLVSKKIGIRTKQWTENVNSKESVALEHKKIELQPEECEKYFEEISQYQVKTDLTFSKHKLIPVTYEDLESDRKAVIEELYREFELDNFERDSELKKQNPESLKDLILNYRELEDHFRGTEWEIYFNGEQR